MSGLPRQRDGELVRKLRRRRERAARRRRNALVDLAVGAALAAIALGLFGYAPVAICALVIFLCFAVAAWRRRRKARAFLTSRK